MYATALQVAAVTNPLDSTTILKNYECPYAADEQHHQHTVHRDNDNERRLAAGRESIIERQRKRELEKAMAGTRDPNDEDGRRKRHEEPFFRFSRARVIFSADAAIYRC